MLYHLLKRSRLALAITTISILAALLFVAAACGDDDGGDSGDVSAQLTAIQEDLDTLNAQVSRTAVYSAVTAMRAQELHQLNLDVQALSSLDEENDYVTRLNRIAEAVAITAWPENLQGAAADLTEKLAAADQAFEDGDLAAVKTHVKDVHDFWHILDADAGTYLGSSSEHTDHAGDNNMDGMSDTGDDGQTDNGGDHNEG